MTKLIQLTLTALLTLATPYAHATSRDEVIQSISTDFTTSAEAGKNIGQMAEYLDSVHDNRAQFAHIYAITINSTVKHLKTGFENPKWVESLIVNYANIYRKTIHRELTGHRSDLPTAWQYEFNFVDSDHWLATFDVIYGIKVHITRDLVEALYVTPTKFSDESQRRDFFRVTTVLKMSMPDIWSVYMRYSRTLPIVAHFTESTVFDWIARLRARAWQDAVATNGLSKKQRDEFLNNLDRESENIHAYGLLSLFQ